MQTQLGKLHRPHKQRTSEEIHGIPKQPGDTCPMIDKVIKAIQNIDDLARKPRYGWDDVNVEDLMSDVDRELWSLVSEMEDIRDNAEKIRTWGEGWKIEALSAIE